MNGGQCLSIFKDFRCQCPPQYYGRYCELEKPSQFLNGEIVIVLNGKRETILGNLDAVLKAIGEIGNMTVRVQIDSKTTEPVIYELNNVDNDKQSYRAKRTKRSSKLFYVVIL